MPHVTSLTAGFPPQPSPSQGFCHPNGSFLTTPEQSGGQNDGVWLSQTTALFNKTWSRLDYSDEWKGTDLWITGLNKTRPNSYSSGCNLNTHIHHLCLFTHTHQKYRHFSGTQRFILTFLNRSKQLDQFMHWDATTRKNWATCIPILIPSGNPEQIKPESDVGICQESDSITVIMPIICDPSSVYYLVLRRAWQVLNLFLSCNSFFYNHPPSVLSLLF